MNKEELTLRKDLSESNEWDEIRIRLLDYCSVQSGNQSFCDNYIRGILYAIKTVDDWANTYYTAVQREHKEKGDY